MTIPLEDTILKNNLLPLHKSNMTSFLTALDQFSLVDTKGGSWLRFRDYVMYVIPGKDSGATKM